eukprot:292104-Hanusia_phi.AAC.1
MSWCRGVKLVKEGMRIEKDLRQLTALCYCSLFESKRLGEEVWDVSEPEADLPDVGLQSDQQQRWNMKGNVSLS